MGAAWGVDHGLACPAAAAVAAAAAVEARHAALQHMGWESASRAPFSLDFDIRPSATSWIVLHGCNHVLYRQLARQNKDNIFCCHDATSLSKTEMQTNRSLTKAPLASTTCRCSCTEQTSQSGFKCRVD